MNSRQVTIAIAITSIVACRSPTAAQRAETARFAEPESPIRAQAPVAPAAATLHAPPHSQDIATRIADAYAKRARGETADAAAAFEAVVKELLSFGKAKAPGLGNANGEIVKGRAYAAFQRRASWQYGA